MKTKYDQRHFGVKVVVLLLILLGASALRTQAQTAKHATAKPLTQEQKGELQLASARTNPLQLRHFLQGMPKGTDLHYHLSGGVYAETFIRDAVEDGLCVNMKELALVKCASAERSEGEKTGNVVPAGSANESRTLYDELVDSFSMRAFVSEAGVSGHDHFFGAFAKFDALDKSHEAEWVDEVASRAASQNVQYMELMATPNFDRAREIAREVGWHDDLNYLRDQFLSRGLQENVRTAVTLFETSERDRRQIEKCGQPDARDACKVEIRFLCQVLRGLAPETVFAQALLCFEAAAAAPDTVAGLNFVMPEDSRTVMQDYAQQMRMVKYLHETYPAVHISLHAGELAYGLVPPSGLCCHVRQAVEAGAERIGHGTDVMFEDHPHELLKNMAATHVMVEIALTSNALVLGVSGKNHPLPMYRLVGVPIALATDDEGVARIDLTNEYVRAVDTYDLKYLEVKNMVRTGLEHAFLPGDSLWAKADDFTKFAVACAKDHATSAELSISCSAFLRRSKKAQQQWELERRFGAFEVDF